MRKNVPEDERRWSSRYPSLGTGSISTRPYIDTDYFVDEIDAVFRRSWLNICRLVDIPPNGGFRVVDFPGMNASVIISRRGTDEIEAFHNVCMHRGNRLITESSGRASRFTCRYHGWTYGNDGRLLAIPDEVKFTGLDKSRCGLRPVPCGVWQGFVFIHLEPDPDQALTDSMAEIESAFSGYPIDSLEEVVTYEADVNANWKVCLDIGKEPYHFLFVHRKSIPDSHTGVGQELAYFPAIRLFDKHRSASIVANPSHRPRAAEAIAFEQMATMIQGVENAASAPPNLNPDKVNNWAFDVHVLYPNCAILLGLGWSVIHRFLPLAVNRTRWLTSLYMTKPRNAGEAVSQEFSKILTRDLLREDLATCETNQNGLDQAVIPEMWLSDQEIMLRHGYEVVEQAVARYKEAKG